MPCNTNCAEYSPLKDPTIGILMTKKQYPYPATGTINAPSWDRDSVMYDFEDICESVNPISRYSSLYGPGNNDDNPVPGSGGYNFNSVNRGGDFSGKLYQPITTSSWWESYRQCGGFFYGGYQGTAQKFRYWDNYPARLSFEPIFSDTWFYYLFDTFNGVTGIPCHTYCFTVTNLGVGDNDYYSYNLTKQPYQCPCHPDETYIKYTLEDGQTNPSHNVDQYPTFWSVGTKRQGIAFQYQSPVNPTCRNVTFGTWGEGGSSGRKMIKFTFTPESAWSGTSENVNFVVRRSDSGSYFDQAVFTATDGSHSFTLTRPSSDNTNVTQTKDVRRGITYNVTIEGRSFQPHNGLTIDASSTTIKTSAGTSKRMFSDGVGSGNDFNDVFITLDSATDDIFTSTNPQALGDGPRTGFDITYRLGGASAICGGTFEISEIREKGITNVIQNVALNTTYLVTAEAAEGSGHEGTRIQLGLKKNSTSRLSGDVIEDASSSSGAIFADFLGTTNDSDDAVLFVPGNGTSGRFYSSNKRKLGGRQTWDIRFKVDSIDNTIPIIAYRPREGQEKFVVFQGGTTRTKVFSLTGDPMFGAEFPNEYVTTQNVTFSNGMVLNMTFECSRRDTAVTNDNTYTPDVTGTSTASMFVKVNSIVTPPIGGWPQYVANTTPSGGIEFSLNPTSPLTNTLLTGSRLGYIVLFPLGHPKNPGLTKSGIPRDYLLSEAKFEGGYYAITTHPGWGTWFRTYAVWTNNKENNLVGRNMTCGMRKIPVSVAGTYTLEIGNDNTGNWILQSWGQTVSDDMNILSPEDENREIYQFHGYNGGQSTITFTTTAPGYINIIVDVFNGGTSTSWNSNPGGFAAVLRRGSTIVWTTRDQTGAGSINFGDAFRGMTLREAGFVDAWNGVSGIPFQSVNGNCWKSGNITTYKDYEIPGGLKLRMMLQSTENDDGTYGTVWKIEKIIEPGTGYGKGETNESGDIDFIDQNKFTLFYPTKNSPLRISVCLVLATTVEDADNLDDVTTRLSPGNTVNGWIVTDVKESNDELNMHLATLKPGTSTNDFIKDTSYVANTGATVKVVAGWGIKDRAALIGLYEFRKKEIEYGVGIATEGMPFTPELIKPSCYAEVSGGRVTNIVIEGRGRGLQHQNITEPRLVVTPPPTQFNHVLFDELIRSGTNVEAAKRRATGVGETAQLKPKFEQGRLVSVVIVNGGSGYSSTNPPDVYVPYISRNKTIVTQEARDPDIDPVQNGQKVMFAESEGFTNMSKVEYEKYDVNIDKNGTAILGTGTTTTGYSWDSYKEDTAPGNKEQSFIETTTNVAGMTLADTKRTSRFENRGIDKSFAQSFKTGKKADKNKDVINVKSKTSDTKTSASRNEATAKYEKEGNFNYDDQFKDFYKKMETGNPTSMQFENMDWSTTSGQNDFTGKTPKNHEGSDPYTGKSVVDQVEEQEKKTDDSFDEMWQRDQEENRIGSWQNTEMRVTKQSFFNLPCRSDKEIFLMRRFCPDPRPWTTISLRLGVVKLPIDANDPTRTHCKECLETTRPDLVTIRSEIRTQFNDPDLDIEDAYCVDTYGLPGAVFYGFGGRATGTWLADFNTDRGIMGSNPYTKEKLRKLTGYQADQTYQLDGCRSYDIHGQLLIYHSLTNETKLWAASVSSYGNPYDFKCGRYYGQQGEEDLYSTEVAGDVIDDNAADMPGYQDYTIAGVEGTPDFPVAKRIPLEGY